MADARHHAGTLMVGLSHFYHSCQGRRPLYSEARMGLRTGPPGTRVLTHTDYAASAKELPSSR